MPESLPLTVIAGVLVAAASGLVGSLLVLRKMTLLSDALSHVALPGIALGVVLHFQPLWGGVAFLFVGVLLIWVIEHKTRLAIESITGVLFVTALAVGALLIPQTDLLEAFFGSVERITSPELIALSAIALVILFVATRYLKPLVLTAIAPDLAAAERTREPRMELLLLILIAITISIGISFVGVLLMSALSIIPAVTARNLASNFRGFVIWSVVIAISALTAGLFIGAATTIGAGIATVLVSAFFFLLSLLKRSR